MKITTQRENYSVYERVERERGKKIILRDDGFERGFERECRILY